MDHSNDGILTAGGIATVVTALGFTIGLLTKYLLDRRKADTERDDGLLVMLQKRVTELEAENKMCMERSANQAQEIGYLKARCELLEDAVKGLRGNT